MDNITTTKYITAIYVCGVWCVLRWYKKNNIKFNKKNCSIKQQQQNTKKEKKDHK